MNGLNPVALIFASQMMSSRIDRRVIMIRIVLEGEW
jgi:hypothetical protein